MEVYLRNNSSRIILHPVSDWDVMILTEGIYLNPTKINPYIRNVLTEQQLVQEALESMGLKVGRVAWADPDFNWSNTRAVLFREIWDYHHRIVELTMKDKGPYQSWS